MRAKVIRLSLCLVMLTWLQAVTGRAEPLQCGILGDACDDENPCCSDFWCQSGGGVYPDSCTCSWVDDQCGDGQHPCCQGLSCQANGLCEGQPSTPR